MGFKIKNGVLIKYIEDSGVTDVVIPSDVTSIGDGAFICSGLTSVVIPGSVASIGSSAFRACKNLKSITIPEGVTIIGWEAFSFCDNLYCIDLPDSITNIGEGAFKGCVSLKNITIPEGVKSVDGMAFWNCSKLRDINVAGKNSAYSSENGILFNKSKTEIVRYPEGKTDDSYTIPDGVTCIGKDAFSNCAMLKSIALPGGVTSIGVSAFYGCSSLTSIAIPESVTSIGWYAFSSSGVENVRIPNSVTSIKKNTFNHCVSLKSITMPDGIINIGDYAFKDCSSLASIKIPNSVTKIGNYAFEHCRSLTNITIPESVTSIGDHAFWKCIGLESINIPNSVTRINRYTFEDCMRLTNIIMSDSIIIIDDYAFSCCNSLNNITIPDSVKIIGDHAFFHCGNLTSITIPDSVAGIIRGSIFSKCNNISEVFANPAELPDTKLKQTALYTFICEPEMFSAEQAEGCKKYLFSQKKRLLPEIFANDLAYAMQLFADAKKITKSNVKTEFLEPAIEAKATQCVAFLMDWENKNVSTDDKEKLIEKKLNKDPFNSADMKKIWSYEKLEDGTLCLTSYKGTETEVVIPERIGKNKVTVLGRKMFSPSKDGRTAAQEEVLRKLSSVIIPDTITGIIDGAFYLCGLESITIPESVTNIGDYAFGYCKNLTSIDIPNSVISVGDKAFYGCKRLKSINIPESVKSVGRSAFLGCSKLRDINVAGNNSAYSSENGILFNKSRTEIVRYPEGKTDDSYTIPDGVTCIGDDAFYGCSCLKHINIPESVTSIGECAFEWCRNLAEIIADPTVFSDVNLTQTAVYSFLNTPEKFNTEQVEGCKKYLFSKRKKLLPEILNKDIVHAIKIFADGKRITKSNIRTEYLNPAIEAKATQCVAFLLDWESKNVSNDDKEKLIEKEFNQDPFNTADMKKIWSYKKLEDETLCLTGYKGTESEIVIPERIGKNKVTVLGEELFSPQKYRLTVQKEALKNLSSIIIPDTITNIAECAFCGCESLTSITMPRSVMSVHGSAFNGCSKLTDIYVVDGNSAYSSENGILFNKSRTEIVRYPEGKTDDSYTIPDSVTCIGEDAFSDCSNIKHIAIPESVTSIGDGAFCDCKKLNIINMPNSVARVGEFAFCGCDTLTHLTISESATIIGANAFRECESLTFIDIPGSVTSIGDDAFSCCYRLASITLSDGLKSIGNGAFSGCQKLSNITIPNSVTIIGDDAFGMCIGLTDINVAEGNSAFISESGILFNKSKSAIVRYPCGKTDVSYTVPNSVVSISNCAFAGCSNLVSITIPDSVRSIEEGAFYLCDKLESITIPKGVTSIEEHTFHECYSLTSITIPDSVTSIGDYAFKNCCMLNIITIPDSVTSIGDCAFFGIGKFKILSSKNSYAKEYAKSQHIHFTAI